MAETKLDAPLPDSHNTVGATQSGDTMGAVGSEAGKLSGHDWKRWAAGVARSAAMAALTYAADNVAGLGLSPWQVLVASQILSGALDLLRRKQADTRVIPVEPSK